MSKVWGCSAIESIPALLLDTTTLHALAFVLYFLIALVIDYTCKRQRRGDMKMIYWQIVVVHRIFHRRSCLVVLELCLSRSALYAILEREDQIYVHYNALPCLHEHIQRTLTKALVRCEICGSQTFPMCSYSMIFSCGLRIFCGFFHDRFLAQG